MQEISSDSSWYLVCCIAVSQLSFNNKTLTLFISCRETLQWGRSSMRLFAVCCLPSCSGASHDSSLCLQTCAHCLSQPYCDGAHKTKAPSIAPLRFSPEKDKTVMLCACKETKNAPYCDGSHFKVIFRDVVTSVKGVFKWSGFRRIACGARKLIKYLCVVTFIICLQTSIRLFIKVCFTKCLV